MGAHVRVSAGRLECPKPVYTNKFTQSVRIRNVGIGEVENVKIAKLSRSLVRSVRPHHCSQQRCRHHTTQHECMTLHHCSQQRCQIPPSHNTTRVHGVLAYLFGCLSVFGCLNRCAHVLFKSKKAVTKVATIQDI